MPYSNNNGYGYVDATTPGYTPSADAGTGYMISDYGASDLSGPGSQYYPFPQGQQNGGQPDQTAYDYGGAGGYDPYANSDFGYGGA